MLSVFIPVLLVSTITYGATTIGSNVDTGGNLTVSGNATLGDNSTDLIKSIGSFNASSTLQATGATRFYSTVRIDGATTLNTVSYTWPSSDGSASTYLQTNGAGTLSWATASGQNTNDWLKQTNFGVLNLTASTTIPYWAKDAIYASSTLTVQGLTTFSNATGTLLTLTGLTNCDTIDTNANGFLICGSDSSGSGISDWLKQTNFGVLNLTASTTIPYWAKDAIYASSTLTVQGLTTFSNATGTLLTLTGLTNCDTIDTNANGFLICGSDSSGSGISDWLKQTNFGVLNLTASTTIPYWAKDAIYASSTLQVQGLTTLSNATTSLLTVSNGAWFTNGNVGIGTTSPGSLLSLNNIANFTTATSSFYGNGINLANGCFAINGTCVGAGGGSGTINSGTTGQLSYYAGNGTTLTATSSLFIHSNQNIGIGTTTPNWLLQAAGVRPFFTLSDTGASADQKHWFLSSQGGNFYIGTSSDALNATSTYLMIETNISGTALTSLGAFTLSSNTTGASSTAIGFQSLQSNTTGNRNTAVGALSLQKNTTGVRNTAVGFQSLYSNTASDNTAIGFQSLYLNTSGTTDVAVGDKTLYANTTGQRNSALGFQALYSNTTASNNTAIGDNALFANTTGASLTAVGRQAGYDNTTGSFNTYIGNDTGSSSVATLTYATAIGAGAQVNRSSSLILGGESNTTYSVDVGIGTTTPNWLLQAAGTRPFFTLSDTGAGTDNKHWFLSSQGGNFYIGTSSDAYATSTSNLLNLISSNYSVGIGTTSPAEQLSVSGRLFVGGTGTSTIQNNLYVMGTLRSTVSYVGDLIFSNNFKFIETLPNVKVQSLFLQNQNGEDIFKINERGQLVVKEIESQKIKTKELCINSICISEKELKELLDLRKK